MAKNQNPLEELEELRLKPAGCYTYPNIFSEVPPGAMKEAINVQITRPSVIEQRRGVNNIGPVFASSVNKLYNFQNHILSSSGTVLSYYSTDLSTRTDYAGSYSAPTGALTIHSIQANKNIYFSTSTGAKKLDTYNGSITFSGAPAGLDGSGTTTGSGWFTDQTQVAYRVIWQYTDANNNLVRGAPSQRIVVANSSGSATNVALTFTVPRGLTTSWQYTVYRSPLSATLTTEPNDECSLVYTGSLTSSQITALVVTLTDSVPDSLKGEIIYTASSQQGITQANYQPPIATDITYFKGFAFYGNTTSLYQSLITLVSVGGSGLVNGDTVTIAGTVYTGASSEVIASAQFQVFTGGTPSQNITNTANSLIRVINRYTGNTSVYAYYQSGYTDLPGRIQIQAQTFSVASFNSASSRAGAFVPDIGTTTLASTNENQPNGIQVSKSQQPEACPIGQTLFAGAADKSILRVIALRDYILIFKQDGVYQISGTDISSFQVALVDDTVILRGIESAVSLNNKVFCFTNQTIVSMTYNEGAVLKSLPIKKDLLVLSSPLYPNFDSVSYGISYESENQYMFATVSNTLDTTATQFFVYNYLTDTWTTYQYPYSMGTGFVNPTDGKLYLGSSDANSRYLYQERKDYTSFDYADNSYPITITSSSGLTVNVVDSTNAQVGYTLNQDDRISVISAIVNATTITVENQLSWVAGAATVYKPILVSIIFTPEAFGNPGIVKHFKECHAIFSTADFDSFDLGFSTDFYQSVNFSTLVPKSGDGFGLGAWGSSPWGSGVPEFQVIRGLVPLPQRRGHWLNISVNYADALSNFSLDGFSLFYSKQSQRFH